MVLKNALGILAMLHQQLCRDIISILINKNHLCFTWPSRIPPITKNTSQKCIQKRSKDTEE